MDIDLEPLTTPPDVVDAAAGFLYLPTTVVADVLGVR